MSSRSTSLSTSLSTSPSTSLSGASGAPGVQGVPRDLGAVAWWRGGDSWDGTNWTDFIGGYVAAGSTHAPDTDTENGINCPDFNGTSHYLDFSASGFDFDGCIRASDHTFAVVMNDPVTSYNDGILSFENDDELQREYWVAWGEAIRHRRQSATSTDVNSTDVTNAAGLRTRATTYVHSSQAVAHYKDGAADGTGTHTLTPSLALTKAYIGAFENLGVITFFRPGLVCEICIFPTALSSGDITTLETYFQSIWVP